MSNVRELICILRRKLYIIQYIFHMLSHHDNSLIFYCDSHFHISFLYIEKQIFLRLYECIIHVQYTPQINRNINFRGVSIVLCDNSSGSQGSPVNFKNSNLGPHIRTPTVNNERMALLNLLLSLALKANCMINVHFA